MRLEHDGTVVRQAGGRPLSQAQLDVLFTLLQAAEGDYRANLAEELELSRVAERLRCGLAGVLRVQTGSQAEEREQAVGVEEERELGDPSA